MSHLLGQTWSMSKLKMLEQCPLNFYLSYIKKYAHIDPSIDTIERDLGLTIHAIFEKIQEGYRIQEAYELIEQTHREVVKDENWPRIINMLPSVKYFDSIMMERDEADPFDTVDPEVKMAIDKDGNAVDFFDENAWFRGIVDYSARRRDEVMLVDFKKGGSGYLTKYHTPQMLSYLMMDFFVNGFSKGEAWIYYVESAQLSRGPSIDGERIATHTKPWLENKIETAIITVEDAGYYEHKRGNYCKYCNFADKCRNGKRGTCGDLTDMSIESKDTL